MTTEALPADLPRRRFTVDEVNRMAEQGILGEDERVELLDGELVVVSPQGPLRAARIAELVRTLGDAYRSKGHVRPQLPLEARPQSLPEPDFAVVRGQPLDYRQRHPNGRDALLVVEIAWTSQQIDRRKVGIYASAGVPVYWLIDLPASQVEVFTEPSAEGVYGQHLVLTVGQEIALPDLEVRWPVSNLVG